MSLKVGEGCFTEKTKEELRAKAVELDYSRKLDVHRWSDYPEVNRVVDRVIRSHPELLKSSRIKKKHLKVVILDLYVCWLEDPDQYIAYSRNKSAYKAGSRYNALYISKMTIQVVDLLINAGLIEHHKGFYDRKQPHKSKESRMRASEKLITLFGSPDEMPDLHLIERPRDTECIVLREKIEVPDDTDENPNQTRTVKKDLEYEDSDHPDIPRWRHDLRAYDNLLRRTYIDVRHANGTVVTSKLNWDDEYGDSKVVRINQHDKFVRRIFSRGEWGLGGRFYGGWWQRLPEAQRLEICIDDQRVHEIDYRGHHIVLLYALKDIDYWQEIDKDPYAVAVDGLTVKDARGLNKLLMLTALNAKNRDSAVRAFRKKMHKDPAMKAKYAAVDLKLALDNLIAFHKPIEEHFCNDEGVILQWMDAQIAAHVINHFTAKDIVVLCVHDSFIVDRRHRSELYEVMHEAFSIVSTSVVSRLKLAKEADDGFGLMSLERLERTHDWNLYDRRDAFVQRGLESDCYRDLTDEEQQTRKAS